MRGAQEAVYRRSFILRKNTTHHDASAITASPPGLDASIVRLVGRGRRDAELREIVIVNPWEGASLALRELVLRPVEAAEHHRQRGLLLLRLRGEERRVEP